MRDKYEEVNRLQEEVLNLRVLVSSQTAGDVELQAMRHTVEILNSKIINLEDQVLRQDEEMAEQTEHTRQAVASLQDAHRLVNKHMDSANKYLAETDKLTKECALLTSQCSALQTQLSAADTNLKCLTLSTQKAAEEWQMKENKLDVILMANNQQLQFLEESKVQQEQIMSRLSERSEELVLQLEQAQSKLNVTRADIGVLAGNSFFGVTDRSLQTFPDVTTMTTQTIGPDTTDGMSQTDHQSSLSSCIQIDAFNTSSTASQTFPFFKLINESNQDFLGWTHHLPQDATQSYMSSEVNHGKLKILLDSCTPDNSFDHGNPELAQIKVENTECNIGNLPTSVTREKQNVNALDSIKDRRVEEDRMRESEDLTDNTANLHSKEPSNNSGGIHSTDGINIISEQGLLEESEQTLPSSTSQVVGRSLATDCNTNNNTRTATDSNTEDNNTRTDIATYMEQVLADYSQQEGTPSIYPDADSSGNTMGSHTPVLNLKGIEKAHKRFSKTSIPLPSLDCVDVFVVRQDKFGQYSSHKSSHTPMKIMELDDLRTKQRNIFTTGGTISDPSCLSQVPLSVSWAEHGIKVSTKLNLMPAPKLTVPQSEYDLNMSSILSFGDSCNIINGQDRTVIIKVDSEQGLATCEADLNVFSSVQSSETNGVCGGRVQSSGAAVICGDKGQSSETTSTCGDKVQSSDTAEACTDEAAGSKTSLHNEHPQTSSSDISNPMYTVCTKDILHTQLDRRSPKEVIFSGQHLPGLQSQGCVELDCYKTVENLIIPSHDIANSSPCVKKMAHSLMLAKPGRATKNSPLFSISSMYTPNLCLKRLSSNTITRTDLEAYPDSPPNSSSYLTMQSSFINPDKEHPSSFYPFLSCSNMLRLDQTQKMKRSSSTDASPAIQQLSYPNQNSWEQSCGKLNTPQRSPSNKSTSISNLAVSDQLLNKPKISPIYLGNNLSSVVKQQRKLPQLRSLGDKQRERSHKPRTKDKSRYQMLFLPSTEKEVNNSVIGCENSSLPATCIKPKGILKASQTNRGKSMITKSVSFPQELEHCLYTQDSQQPNTSAARQVNIEMKYVDSPYLTLSEMTDHPLTSTTVGKEFQPNLCTSTHLKDDHSTSLTSKGIIFNSPSRSLPGFSLSGQCLTVPETPNLELSDAECEITCSPTSTKTSSESPVTTRNSQRAHHFCEEVADDSNSLISAVETGVSAVETGVSAVETGVSAVETGVSAAKKHRTC